MFLSKDHSRRILKPAIVLLAGCLGLIQSGPVVRGDQTSARPPKAQTPAMAQYQKGVTALEEGHVSAAEDYFRAALKLDAKLAPAMLGLADVSVRHKDMKGAGSYLQQALAAAPANAAVQTAWGHYLTVQKQYPQAEAVLKKDVATHPADARARIELANLYLLGMRKPQQAIPLYREALKINPSHMRAHYALAGAFQATGQYEPAVQEMEAAVRLAPQDPVMLQALGVLYESRREYDKALGAFAQALHAQPNYFPAHVNRGGIFLQQGKPGQALEEFKQATHIAPKDPAGYLGMGQADEASFQPDAAREAYKWAFQAAPNFAPAYNNLAWLDAQQKQHLDEALSAAQKAVALDPKDANYMDTLAWVQHVRGNNAEALKSLAAAARLNPHNPEVIYHMGVIHQEMGNKREAAGAFQKALGMGAGFNEQNDARQRLAQLQPSARR